MCTIPDLVRQRLFAGSATEMQLVVARQTALDKVEKVARAGAAPGTRWPKEAAEVDGNGDAAQAPAGRAQRRAKAKAKSAAAKAAATKAAARGANAPGTGKPDGE